MFFTFQSAEKKMFYRELATLLTSGFSILVAFEHLANNTYSHNLKTVILYLKREVSEGSSLTEAISLLKLDFFLPFEVGVIEAGEVSGNLPESFSKLAEYFEFVSNVQNKLISGLTYPVILLHLAILIPAVPSLFLCGIGAFLIKVVPSLLGLYIVFFGILFLYRYSNRSPSIAKTRDKIFLEIPALGKFIKTIEVIRFLKSFIPLYVSGVELSRSVALAGDTIGNLYLRENIKKSVPIIRQGAKLSEVFAEKEWIPPIVKDMLKTGELSGNMDETLDKVSDYLKEETDIIVEQFVKLMPVAVYLLVAIYIGYIVISFYANYFRMLNSFM